jgi:large subunit ribosomal protein L3
MTQVWDDKGVITPVTVLQFGEGEDLASFKPGDLVKVTGISIGKGTAGTIKRWHFSRGPMSHGSKSHRLPGSIGAGTTPGRVEKGTRMSGRLGNKKISVKNLKVVRVDAEKGLLLIKGAVPGPGKNMITVNKA